MRVLLRLFILYLFLPPLMLALALLSIYLLPIFLFVVAQYFHYFIPDYFHFFTLFLFPLFSSFNTYLALLLFFIYLHSYFHSQFMVFAHPLIILIYFSIFINFMFMSLLFILIF